ncbi:outer membrane protein assembly factor BamE domain-containing protein [Deferrisoma sp.]
MFRAATLLAAALLALSACATTSGRRVAQEDLDRIQKGKTTRVQVIEILGEPQSVKQTAEGTILVYGYSEARADATSYVPYLGSLFGKTKTENQVVYIFLDKAEVVREIQVEQGRSESGQKL